MTTATAHDWKAQQMARDVAAKALAAANPRLVPVAGKVDGLQAAAKNIRLELKAAFPAIKFSVKSRRFSGGDAIDVRWTDGPTAGQVDAIVQRYAAGRFDGMTDCYDHTRDAWRDAFGDAMYIHATRDNSDRAIASAIRTVAASLGLEQPPTLEQYRSGALWNVVPFQAVEAGGLQGEINRTAARRTWAIAKRAA